jgi:hypothetical protein
MSWEGMMPILSPAQLRADSRSARQIAATEANPHIERLWTSYAVALAELAEQIERGKEAARVKELVA